MNIIARSNGAERAQFDLELVAAMPKLRADARWKTKNAADADDLLSATMLRALDAWHQFEPGTNFIAWMRRILFTTMIMNFRAQKLRPVVGFESDQLDKMGGETYGPDRIYEGRRELALVMDLPLAHQEVLATVVFDEMSYDEAAERLGLSIGTIKSRLFCARRTLRELAGIGE